MTSEDETSVVQSGICVSRLLKMLVHILLKLIDKDLAHMLILGVFTSSIEIQK